ncbi:AGE family epimerase/isomerase [Mycobacterium sp.]|uniref:AGE family epimerase/isomerase n=1 Tax=Mycobacterium sp. TaxID=1785 RepID=UPI003F94BE9E
MTDMLQFTFSDTIAGYVVSYDEDENSFVLRTTDDRDCLAYLTSNTWANAIRNFGEDYRDVTGQLADMLYPGRYLFAYGIFYPEGDQHRFEVKSIVFPGLPDREYLFEEADWWVNQVRAVADFYLRGQFPDGNYDWHNYRTKLTLAGTHTPDYIAPDFKQETDTISRLVYGLATAYLLTGEDRFLEAAEAGTLHLRENMRGVREDEGIVYWFHGVDVSQNGQRQVLASEFGDDFDAIPMYEQIYALAGPTQTYRVTGDPRILDDIDKTVALFERFFRDPEQGGYFSHLDPVSLDPRSNTLGHNRARKNWNSVGDHAPAYLINALLATGRKDLEDFLAATGDTIAARFPDYDNSPFVQERFHEDWSHDHHYKWQQDSAVVGHNLKIAWNLMRINNVRPNDAYVKLARKIAEVMPAVGSDQQRGGWYDLVERRLAPGQQVRRFVNHDRKAWWQQEQAILAYLILAGTLGEDEHLRLGRESASFYNAWFLDHDDGGVYFNVLASGLPYLLGNERLKGSHSMSGYHSTELCYLAAVYTNLLIREQPLELHFKPKASSFPDGILRVAPDLLPPGRAKLSNVWVDDEPYTEFDKDKLTVNLPQGQEVRVRVRLVSTKSELDSRHEQREGEYRLTLLGAIPPRHLDHLRADLAELLRANPRRLVLEFAELESLSEEAVSVFIFFLGKVRLDQEIHIVGANDAVKQAFASIDSALSNKFIHLDSA